MTARALQDLLRSHLSDLDTLAALTSPDAPQGDLARAHTPSAPIVCELGELLTAHRRRLDSSALRELVEKLTA